MPEAVAGGQSAQGGGEETGREGVTGADGGDDVDVRSGNVDDVAPVEDGRAASALLDNEHLGVGERGPDGVGALQRPHVPCLVLPHEHQVGAARQVQQQLRPAPVLPQSGPVVDVEGDERAAGAGCGQFAHEVGAVRGERRRDARQVQHPSGPRRRHVDVPDRHRGGRRPGPVVGHLVGVGGPVPRGTEVDAGRARRVARHGGDVDAVRPDRLDQVVAEPVGAHPAHPARRVSRRGQYAGHVGLGAADGTLEGGDVGEAARAGGQEGDHGLAERDDVHDVGGVAGSVGGHACRVSSARYGSRRLR